MNLREVYPNTHSSTVRAWLIAINVHLQIHVNLHYHPRATKFMTGPSLISLHGVEHTSLNHWYAHPPCGAHLSQPLVCTSTVWSTPLSATGMHAHPLCGAHLSQPLVCMHIHRVEHTSLSHWYACTSTVWSTPLSATGMHTHRVEHTSLSHWYAHPPCGVHLSQPLVCTSTVWSTPLSTTGMHAPLCMLPVCNLDTHSVLFDTEFCLDQK